MRTPLSANGSKRGKQLQTLHQQKMMLDFSPTENDVGLS